MVLVSAVAAGGGITKILGCRRKYTLQDAKYAHRVLNSEANGNPKEAIRILEDRIKVHRMELDALETVLYNKQQEMSRRLHPEINCMKKAIEILRNID